MALSRRTTSLINFSRRTNFGLKPVAPAQKAGRSDDLVRILMSEPHTVMYDALVVCQKEAAHSGCTSVRNEPQRDAGQSQVNRVRLESTVDSHCAKLEIPELEDFQVHSRFEVEAERRTE